MPVPEHPDHHFVFDHAKWMHDVSNCHAILGGYDRVLEHAREVVTQHGRPDGTNNAPCAPSKPASPWSSWPPARVT
jgi:hypothetical protein